MNNVILPFLTSMLLGRTIDLTTYTINGINVYDDAEYDETTINTLNATYNVLQEDHLPYSSFGIPADLALRIKSNSLSSSSGATGLDGVLKDTSWKYNSAVVTATIIHRTVDRTLKKDATPLPQWSEKVPSTQTHYASSLIYGGWSVILFQLRCDIPSDVYAVRKVLTRNLGVIGKFSNDTTSKWHEAMKEISADEDIRGRVKLVIHVYSTVPFNNPIDSPDSLLEAISDLPNLVGSVGRPLYMNLKPLHDLDEKYPIVEQIAEMKNAMEKLDRMFDDVKLTKASMMRWMSETMSDFDHKQEAEISNLLHLLNECIRAFNKFGNEVSLFKPMDRELLGDTFQMYLGGLQKGVGTYNLAYRRLKEEIDAECENAFLHKIKGLLRVYDEDVQEKGEVNGGLEECQQLCVAEKRCRSIGYAPHASQLDMTTGLYLRKEKLCWVYLRSSSTAAVYTPSGLYGDLGVYDRKCY